MVYMYLFIAIFLEVVAAIATRFTNGFTAPLPTTITIIFAVASYFIFSLSLKNGMGIGIGYALWSGIGILSVTIIAVFLFQDTLTLIQIGGVLLVIVGLTAVQLGGKATKT